MHLGKIRPLISSVKASPVASVGMTLSFHVYVRFISFTKRNLLMKATIHHSVSPSEELYEISNIHDVFNTCVTMTCTVLGKPEGYRFYKFYTRMLHFIEVDRSLSCMWVNVGSNSFDVSKGPMPICYSDSGRCWITSEHEIESYSDKTISVLTRHFQSVLETLGV